jgi:acyl-CoA reductase-like NAD-dependent aldehyde dehydrogenase
VDFNGTDRSRSLTEAGAYTYTTPDNPGWTIQEGFKEIGTVCIYTPWELPGFLLFRTINPFAGTRYTITGKKAYRIRPTISGIYIYQGKNCTGNCLFRQLNLK